MKKIFIVITLILTSLIGFGQQQPLYSQYMLNSYLINPAVAGAEGVTMFNLTVRDQWVGYKDSPKTYALSAQTRILKTSYRNRSRLIKSRIKKRKPSGRVGLGAMVYNDVNGKVRRTGLQATYAYHIYVKNVQISFGTSFSAYQFSIDVKPTDLYDQTNDPLVNGRLQKLSPDANFGVLINSEKYYVGLSMTSLFQSSIQFGNGTSNTSYRLLRQYYLMGGYKFEPYRSDFAYEPSVLITSNEKINYSIDLNFKTVYKNNYYIGLSYRSVGAIILLFGIRYNQFTFGYAYDHSFTDVSMLSKIGSHEIMISYKFGDVSRRYRWLNRF